MFMADEDLEASVMLLLLLPVLFILVPVLLLLLFPFENPLAPADHCFVDEGLFETVLTPYILLL